MAKDRLSALHDKGRGIPVPVLNKVKGPRHTVSSMPHTDILRPGVVNTKQPMPWKAKGGFAKPGKAIVGWVNRGK
jgi:hypothetical protein